MQERASTRLTVLEQELQEALAPPSPEPEPEPEQPPPVEQCAVATQTTRNRKIQTLPARAPTPDTTPARRVELADAATYVTSRSNALPERTARDELERLQAELDARNAASRERAAEEKRRARRAQRQQMHALLDSMRALKQELVRSTQTPLGDLSRRRQMFLEALDVAPAAEPPEPEPEPDASNALAGHELPPHSPAPTRSRPINSQHERTRDFPDARSALHSSPASDALRHPAAELERDAEHLEHLLRVQLERIDQQRRRDRSEVLPSESRLPHDSWRPRRAPLAEQTPNSMSAAVPWPPLAPPAPLQHTRTSMMPPIPLLQSSQLPPALNVGAPPMFQQPNQVLEAHGRSGGGGGDDRRSSRSRHRIPLHEFEIDYSRVRSHCSPLTPSSRHPQTLLSTDMQ